MLPYNTKWTNNQYKNIEINSVEGSPFFVIQFLCQHGPAAICIVLYDSGTLLPIQAVHKYVSLQTQKEFANWKQYE